MPHSDLPDAEVIVDEIPMSGEFNMSMDEALLQLGPDRLVTVVRVYEWSQPTVTLGYFQSLSMGTTSPFPGLPTVRRLSGGGAILHHHELTYSCVLPAVHPVRNSPSYLYKIIHLALIQHLRDCGVACLLRDEHDAISRIQNEPETAGGVQADPFLCFLRSNPNDIVHSSGFKIVGSAQRRRRGVTLQHGSILLSASELSPEVPGIQQLSPDWDIRKFREALPGIIANAISRQRHVRSYTAEEVEACSRILSEIAAS